MQILIVNFELKDRDHEAYEQQCLEFAPFFAAIPGLVTKQWLANHETNTYGGLYLFEDEQSLEAYLQSELFAQLPTFPNFTNISVKRFGTIEAASNVTGGAIFAKAA